MKDISSATKRNKIVNYMDALPEEFDVIDEKLDANDPTITLQTKTRILTLSCDSKGKIIEHFSMREGAGSKEDFLKKQDAYNAIMAYYNDYYTGAKIIENSFDKSIVKIDLENRVVTFNYNEETHTVEETDKVKKSRKKQSYEQISLFDLPKSKVRNEEASSNEDKGTSNVDIIEAPKEKNTSIKINSEAETKYEKWSDGMNVTNIFNNKEYRVKKDSGNIIEVFDKEMGYLIMARADLTLNRD